VLQHARKFSWQGSVGFAAVESTAAAILFVIDPNFGL
jgi:hypothetical protein